jgi:hypothetical protein
MKFCQKIEEERFFKKIVENKGIFQLQKPDSFQVLGESVTLEAKAIDKIIYQIEVNFIHQLFRFGEKNINFYFKQKLLDEISEKVKYYLEEDLNHNKINKSSVLSVSRDVFLGKLIKMFKKSHNFKKTK